MSGQVLTLRFSTQPEYTHKIFDIIEKLLDVVGLNETARHAFIIALGEALDNAIVHGNKMDKSKSIEITCVASEDQISCSVKDKGDGFDHKTLLARPLEDFDPKKLMRKAAYGRVGGLGLSLIRKCVNEVSFNQDGNEITFTKYLAASPEKELVGALK